MSFFNFTNVEKSQKNRKLFLQSGKLSKVLFELIFLDCSCFSITGTLNHILVPLDCIESQNIYPPRASIIFLHSVVPSPIP